MNVSFDTLETTETTETTLETLETPDTPDTPETTPERLDEQLRIILFQRYVKFS
jgi:hypothetical protein